MSDDERIEHLELEIKVLLANNKGLKDKIDEQSKEIKELKEKNKKAIDFINDKNNYFEDGENWQNVLKIKEILEEERSKYMEIWDLSKHKNIETPKKVIKFLNEIDNICKKYNFSISHEDSHGAFILEKYDDYNIKWLKDCMLDLEEDESIEEIEQRWEDKIKAKIEELENKLEYDWESEYEYCKEVLQSLLEKE